MRLSQATPFWSFATFLALMLMPSFSFLVLWMASEKFWLGAVSGGFCGLTEIVCFVFFACLWK